MLTGIKTETKVIIQFLKKPIFIRIKFCNCTFEANILWNALVLSWDTSQDHSKEKNKSINAKQKHQQKLEDVYKFYWLPQLLRHFAI